MNDFRALTVWAFLCTQIVSCGDPDEGQFIALTRDFTSFQQWERITAGSEPLTAHPAGPRFVHVNARPPVGSTEWPQGTVIVKTIENGDPSTWEIFGMVKRGGSYNPLAPGWEFFSLGFGINGQLGIIARGVNAMNHGYTDSLGNAVQCTDCHGMGAAATDHLLTPELRLIH